MASEKHRKARDWLLRSGYGLEMRVAAECRMQSLPTIQSVPYVDPTQANTVREADVVVRFGDQLSMSGDSWFGRRHRMQIPDDETVGGAHGPGQSYRLRGPTGQDGLSR